jgi:hypothetical protein
MLGIEGKDVGVEQEEFQSGGIMTIVRIPSAKELDDAAVLIMNHYDETKNPPDDLHDACVQLARVRIVRRHLEHRVVRWEEL